MTKDEAIDKIKEQMKKLMSFSVDAPVEEKKMETIKLKDGSEIAIADGTDLAVDVEVFVIDDKGNQTPCPDGDYILDDGSTITVASGKVSAMGTDAESTSEDSPAAPAAVAEAADPAATPAPGAAPDDSANPMEDRIASLENQVSQILEILQSMTQTQEATMTKLSAIGLEPASKSINLGKPVNVEFGGMKSEIEELKALRNKFNMNGNNGFVATKG